MKPYDGRTFWFLSRDCDIMIGRNSGIVGEIQIDANREINLIRISEPSMKTLDSAASGSGICRRLRLDTS
jgi:hypothetical protein